MAREEGIVIGIEKETATVKTSRSAACEGCASQGSCMAKGNDMEVRVDNVAGARVGDRVVIEFDSGALLKVTFLLYVFPVICLLVGALAGNAAGERMGVNPSAVSAALAFALFFASYLLVRYSGNRMAGKEVYRPRIVRVMGQGVLPGCPTTPSGTTP